MKRILSIILISVLLFSALATFGVSAATTDFKIDGGVLYEYTGTATNITIPSDVWRIEDNTFSANKNITSVNLANVTMIGNRAFYDCSNLSVVSGGGKVAFVGAYAFENTKFQDESATDVIIGSVLVHSNATGTYTTPTAVKSISPYAFVSNTKITAVSVADGVSQIGEGAFYGCSNLSSVSVSKQVSYIGAYAFEGTAWMGKQTAEFVILGDGILIKYSGAKTNINIPETVKHIGEGVFYRNVTVNSVTIPESVVTIGMRAFADAKALSSVSFPESLVSIGKEAFTNCTSLKEIVIPENVQTVGDSAFLGCSKLATVTYHSDSSIPRGLFADCQALKSVWVASELNSIGDYAFLNCKVLTEISIPNTARAISTNAFSGCEKFTAYANKNTQVYSRLELMGVNVLPMGDANCDGKVDVKDATFIQKSIAKTVTLSFSGILRGDVNFSGDINVKDGTQIQKNVAGIM